MTDYWKKGGIPPDKRAHAWMGAALAVASAPLGYWLLPGYFWPAAPLAAALTGLGLAWLAGLGKEIYDHFIHHKPKAFDPVDWWATGVGGVAGGLVLVLASALTGAGGTALVAAGLLVLSLAITLFVLRRQGVF